MRLKLSSIIMAALGAVLGTPSVAHATTCSVSNPYSFDTTSIANTLTANASPVMGNFYYLQYCADTNLAPLSNPHFTGNVGVGTSTPTAPLTVAGNLRVFDSGSATAGGYIDIGGGITGANIGYLGSTGPLAGDSASDVELRASNNLRFYAGGGAEWVRVTSSGYVGIGTTNPPATLTVSHSGAEGIEFIPASGGGIDAVQFYNRTAGTYDMGRFIAGSYRWDIAGTQKAGLDASGNFSVVSLVSCGGIQTNATGVMSCTSDTRLKDLHGRFSAGLSELLGIQPVSYSWKSGTSLYDGGAVYYGFVAQNVQAALPEAVSRGPDNYLRISQLTILAASVNAIKELKLQADQQAAEVRRLTAANAALTEDVRVQSDAIRQLRKQMAELRRKSHPRIASN